MGSDATTEKADRHVVGSAEEIGPGQRKVVKIGGREIGVFNVDGQFYGVRNICPHRTGPLCLGRLRPLVAWEGAKMVFERENEILKCPWHQYEFDIKTGECLVDPKMKVRSYRVEQEGNDVILYA